MNKKGLLVNVFSPAFFSYVEDCETYDEALVTLKRVYVKGKNDVFARHIHAAEKRRVAESLEQFLQALNLLSKDCTFQRGECRTVPRITNQGRIYSKISGIRLKSHLF